MDAALGGGAAGAFAWADAALGALVGGVAGGFARADAALGGLVAAEGLPRVAAVDAAAAAPAEGEPPWAGADAPGVEPAGALARPVATADWSSAA